MRRLQVRVGHVVGGLLVLAAAVALVQSSTSGRAGALPPGGPGSTQAASSTLTPVTAQSPAAPQPPAQPLAPGTGQTGQGGSVSVNLGGSLGKPSTSITIIIGLTLLAVAPSLLILLTSFTRIIIVLSLTRQALGLQNVPPNQVLAGLALFLTLFDKANPKPPSPQALPMSAVVPAFALSEVRTAFIIGFVIFIPFLVIDLVVSSTLMSLGMMMLPPSLVSLPFKLLLFVMVNGWALVVQSLITSFHT